MKAGSKGGALGGTEVLVLFICLFPLKVTQYMLSVHPLPFNLSDMWKHFTRLKEPLEPRQSRQMPLRFTGWPMAMT